jgi:hypothetical protein
VDEPMNWLWFFSYASSKARALVEKQFFVSIGKGLMMSVELKDIIYVIENRVIFVPVDVDRQKKSIYGVG